MCYILRNKSCDIIDRISDSYILDSHDYSHYSRTGSSLDRAGPPTSPVRPHTRTGENEI